MQSSPETQKSILSLDDLDFYLNEFNNIENFTISLVIGLFIYIACLVLIVFSLLNVKKLKTNRGITITDISSNISPIVFLRSFELNKSSLSGLTFDEYLCNGFPYP